MTWHRFSRNRVRRATGVVIAAVMVASGLALPAAAGPAAAAAPVGPATGRFIPVASALLADAITVAAGQSATVAATGRAGVPTGAAGVSVTVSVRATAAGNLTVRPGDAAAPPGPSVSYRAGVWTRTSTVSRVSDAGTLVVGNGGTTAATVSIEVNGYYSALADEAGGTVFTPLSPVRMISAVSVPANGTVTVPSGMISTTSAGLRAVAMTVTATATAVGSISIYPAGGAAPRTPQIELLGASGVYAANHVSVRTGTNGAVTIANSSTVAATVTGDVHGYYSDATVAAGAGVVPITPGRLHAGTITIPASGAVDVSPLGKAGVPTTGVSAVCLTIGVAQTTANNFLVVYPSGTAKPARASGAYYSAAPSTSFAYALLGANGAVTVGNRGSVAVTVTVDTTCYTRAATAPAAPTEVTATGGDRSATVFWRAVISDAPLLDYTVTATPGGATATVPATATTAIVPGLTNGTAYQFSVKARSAVASSPASVPSAAVTPAPPRVLRAPLVTNIYPRQAALKVSWAPPADGAAAVTSYTVTASPGGVSTTVPGTVTETVLGGLINGTSYSVTVTAVNANGAGPASPKSEYATPRAADVPLQPPALLPTPGDGFADLQWVRPSDGGAPITGYTVTVNPGGISVPVAADTTVARLPGLVNGTSYTLQVVARNSAGVSKPATVTGVVPAASRRPGAPADIRAGAASAGAVRVQWGAPVDAGTSAISSYTVTVTPGGRQLTVTGTEATVTGLDPAVRYTFAVTAANAQGTGPAGVSPGAIRPVAAMKTTPHVLTTAELGSLQDVQGSTLVFVQPPASLTALPAGTVLAVPASRHAPRGMLRAIDSISADAGLARIETREVPLTDVFSEAQLASITDIGNDDIAAVGAASPAVRRAEPTLKGRTLAQGANRADPETDADLGLRNGHVVVELELALNKDMPDDVAHDPGKVPPTGGKLEVQLDLAPHLENEFDISLTDGVHTRHLVQVAYQAQIQGKIGIVLQGKKDLPGFDLKARCFNVQAGLVPIVVCLELNVKPVLEIDGSVGLVFTAAFGRVVGAELKTGNGLVTDVRGINSPYGPDSASLTGYSDAHATVSAPIEATVYFYGTAGPGLIIRPYAEAFMDTTQNPWAELRVGVTVGVFLRSRKFFGKEIDFSTEDLVDLFYTVFQAAGPYRGLAINPKTAVTDPRTPVKFTAAPVGYPADTVIKWRLVYGSGTVSALGVFTPALSGSAVIEAYSPATSTHEELAQRAQITVTGVSLPGAPQQATAKAEPRAATVSWKPPATDGNSPITHYAVVTLPIGVAITVPASQRSLTVPDLIAGRAYRFRVYAINAVGTGEPSEPTAPVEPLKALLPVGGVMDLAADSQGHHDDTGTAGSFGMAVSGDGRYVFFGVSGDSVLAPAEVPSSSPYLLRKDRVTGAIALASRGVDGHTPEKYTGGINAFDVSHDGNTVLFASPGPYGSGRYSQTVLRHDMAAGRTTVMDGGVRFYGISPVKLVAGATKAVFSAEVDDFSSDLFIASGTAAPARMPCPPNMCYDLHLDSQAIDVDEALTSIVYTNSIQGGKHVVRHDVATGVSTDLSPTPGGTLSRPYASSNSVAISRDGTFVGADFRYSDGYSEQTGILRAPARTADLSTGDIIFTYPADNAADVVALSENGRMLGYLEEVVPADFLQYQSLYLYDTARRSRIAIAGGPGTTIDTVRLADNASIVLWNESRWDANGNSVRRPGVWGQALG